ncbi:MAG: XRE family transcriptional regulator [Firmicutes bacterium]|nr:XRE family transcriptional regulator [Bacillota bacterium]
MLIDEIGVKIKQLRLENSLTQEELANRCELTKGFISQIENNLTSPSISTLTDILEVLGSSLGEFFNDSEEEAYVFTSEDFYEKFDEELQNKIKWIVPNAQKYEMEPIILELEPGGKSHEDDAHSGEEFGYVLKGSIILILGKKRYVVNEGNSFYYIANKFHFLENNSKEKSVVLWVSTPPMF